MEGWVENMLVEDDKVGTVGVKSPLLPKKLMLMLMLMLMMLMRTGNLHHLYLSTASTASAPASTMLLFAPVPPDVA